MIVLDASVVVDLVLNVDPAATRIAQRIVQETPGLCAPHLLDAEVGQVLRRFCLRGDIAAGRAVHALDDFLALPIERCPHTPLLQRSFELRDNATVYDALYLALAEGLDAPLLTRDSALANIPGCTARVEVV